MPRGGDGPGVDVGRLYDEYGVSLYRYALMILADPAGAEDVVQQVFVALLAGRQQLETEERYLRRAVRNSCYSALRRRVRQASERPLLEAVDAARPPDERIAIEAAMKALPPDQREVVHLHVFEGRTFQDIADLTSESINTVASRYRYAVARLRQILTS